jgi:hypothetical protein
MDKDTRDAITWVLGTMLSLATLAALLVRFVLFPWLKDHLVSPVRETHRQVAENGHADQEQPTIPDRLEDLSAQVAQATQAHEQQNKDTRAITRVLDEHLRWSNRFETTVERELQQLRDWLAAHTQNGD